MNDTMPYSDPAVATEAMIVAGHLFHQRGWVPASGGNFSARVAHDRLLITASGGHKGELTPAQFLVTDLDGKALDAGRKTSYETGLHVQVYGHLADAGCVLHTHSRANTVLSRRFERVSLSGFELMKVLPGQPDPGETVVLPVFENDQDIARLAAKVDARMRATPFPAYLIAGHGLYAWGRNVAQARYAVEALEFMLDCLLTELATDGA